MSHPDEALNRIKELNDHAVSIAHGFISLLMNAYNVKYETAVGFTQDVLSQAIQRHNIERLEKGDSS
jgi:hypothetical protein